MSDVGGVAAGLQRRWYATSPPWFLRPPGALYAVLMRWRRRAYARGLLASEAVAVPVIVVGNLSVGGTGKTPLTAALASLLRDAGRRPGIASRGHGGTERGPWRVTAADTAARVGDEPVLLAALTGVPVCVARRRAAAARRLVEEGCDVVLCDDGLQHLALRRDREIVVIDALRGLGNGACLPAGPLREPLDRLATVDLVVFNGTPSPELQQQLQGLAPLAPQCVMRLVGDSARPLCGGMAKPLSVWHGQRVHAVAGIGHPQRFFDMLRAAGLQPVEHPFPDHHAYTAADIAFADAMPVLMTSKDAVKCRLFAGPQHHEVPVTAVFDAAGAARLRDWLAATCGTPAP
ncbi:MAG: Tetraacyldisaccharide 4-kinase [Pseudomonadota bacterium]|jgi:tetraacyldisaccharide 4'-kinase